jgi:hypothetical protein
MTESWKLKMGAKSANATPKPPQSLVRASLPLNSRRWNRESRAPVKGEVKGIL